MNARILIEAIVRQMTVLLAELATSGGLRSPLANIADQVFIELARELDGHGISRTVSADMFGMALRTYLRRIRRYDESVMQKGSSLWEAVLAFIEAEGVVTRTDVVRRFSRDEDALVRGVLQDLTDTGLVFRSGVRDAAVYQQGRRGAKGTGVVGSGRHRCDGLGARPARRPGVLSAFIGAALETYLADERARKIDRAYDLAYAKQGARSAFEEVGSMIKAQVWP